MSLYYALGIEPSATDEEVRKAYKRKALATHPDKLPSPTTEKERISAENHFRRVLDAFEILGDPEKRKAYDARRQRSRTNPSEDLLRRMKERQEWARKQEEEHKVRMAAIKNKEPEEEIVVKDMEAVTKLVKEMTDALNEAIPGWSERRKKVEQTRAEREKRATATAKLLRQETM